MAGERKGSQGLQIEIPHNTFQCADPSLVYLCFMCMHLLGMKSPITI